MPTWLTGMGAKIAAFGGLLLAILLAILGIERKGEKAGEAKVTAQSQKETLDAVKKAQEVQQTVSTQTESATKKELDQWARS